jgi:hypothetical protein
MREMRSDGNYRAAGERSQKKRRNARKEFYASRRLFRAPNGENCGTDNSVEGGLGRGEMSSLGGWRRYETRWGSTRRKVEMKKREEECG